MLTIIFFCIEVNLLTFKRCFLRMTA